MICFREQSLGFLDLYWIPLDFEGAVRESWWKVLDAEERERADRFYFQQDRDRWVASRALLRGLLGKYLDLPPEELSFQTDHGGKPRLSISLQGQTPLFFNISHSQDRMLVGLSSVPEVGVDTESIRSIDTPLDLARRFFAPSEYKQIEAAPPQDRLSQFYAIWTRKEAFLKATGEGLSRNLDSFEISLDPESVSPVRIDNHSTPPARWYLSELALEESYVSAFCIAGKPEQIRTYRVRHEERDALLK